MVIKCILNKEDYSIWDNKGQQKKIMIDNDGRQPGEIRIIILSGDKPELHIAIAAETLIRAVNACVKG